MAKAKEAGKKKVTSLNTAIKEVKKEKEEELSLEEEVEGYDSPSELSFSRGMQSGVLESGEVQEGPADVDIRTPGQENQEQVRLYGKSNDAGLYGIQGTEQERLSYATSSGRISEGGLQVNIHRSFAVERNPGALETHQEQQGLHGDNLEDGGSRKYDPVHDKKAKRYAWEV